MKKLFILFLSVVIFCNHTLQAQPVVPSTSPFTRTILPLPTLVAWQVALGIGGGGGGSVVTNFITTNSGIGSTASSALAALGGASLTASNTWSTNGQNFPSIVWHYSTNVYSTPATLSSTNNSGVIGATGNPFAGWPRYGMSVVINGGQYWVKGTNNANVLSIFPNTSGGSYTNLSAQFYYPEDAFMDINGNQQGAIGAGGMFVTASGNNTFNAADGGYRIEDGKDSIRAAMLNPGGSFGESYQLFSDANNEGPIMSLAAEAPSYDFIELPNGVMDFRAGITNDQGQLVIENPTLVGTIIFPNQASNTFYAGPKNNGASAAPSFRLMDKTDLAAAQLLQAGETNLSAASSVIVQYKINMADTNYNVHLTGDAATLAAPIVTAQTTSNFSASFTSFTGGLNWTVIERTQ